MKEIKLQIDGTEITAQIDESELAKLNKPERARTGYERVEVGETFYATAHSGMTEIHEGNTSFDNMLFVNGNYVNIEQLGKDRFRARVLYDRLEQWQALNDEPVDWDNSQTEKWNVDFDYYTKTLVEYSTYSHRKFGVVYFSTCDKLKEAIDVFHDELMWYYTKYRSRLDEKRTELEE